MLSLKDKPKEAAEEGKQRFKRNWEKIKVTNAVTFYRIKKGAVVKRP